MSQSIGVYIAFGCKTPPRWRMVMAVCLNRLVYTLQLDAKHLLGGEWSWLYVSIDCCIHCDMRVEHLLGGEWSWLYVSIDCCIHCNWMQNTSSAENGHGCMSQSIGVYIA